ncbi:MAG: metallophosphoesterase [Planctomycetes bacterium]|nr:metallophosphoesterase [Planctomycetota bacterium]
MSNSAGHVALNAAAPERFTVFAGADPQNHLLIKEETRAIAARWAESEAAFSIIAGDLVHEATDEGWALARQWMQPLLDAAAARGRPLFTIPGNHDWQDFDLEMTRYRRIMAMPHNQLFYSVGFGPLHVAFAATAYPGENGRFAFRRDEQSEPFRWLRADLAAARARGARWILAVTHWPDNRYGSGRTWHPTEEADAFAETCAEGGVDLCLRGHDHLYDRTFALDYATGERRADGIVFCTAGGMGGKFTKVRDEGPRPTSACTVPQRHHYLQLDFSGRTLAVAARDADGNAFDQFEIVK